MRLAFRTIINTDHEIAMGHKIWFRGLEGFDTISTTANNSGFTPLNAICRFYEFDRDFLNEAANACNSLGEVAVVRNLSPRVLLVPRTRGRGDAEFLIEDLFNAATAINTVNLHFTHYGFLQGRFPEDEALTVIHSLLGKTIPKAIERVVIDVDARVVDRFVNALRNTDLLHRVRGAYDLFYRW